MRSVLHGRAGCQEHRSPGPRLRITGAVVAFTLVELLVVISILAILAGLLLPGVRLVRSSVETGRCQGNQRQIGLAILAYAADNESFLPAGRCDPGGTMYASYDQVLGQYDGRDVEDLFTVPIAIDPKAKKLWGQYACPSEREVQQDPRWIAARTGYAQGSNFFRTYALNGALSGSGLVGIYRTLGGSGKAPNRFSTAVHLSQVGRSSRCILLAEVRYLYNRLGFDGGEDVAFPGSDPNGQGGQIDGRIPGAQAPLHRTRWNYLCVDGHVESLTGAATNSPGTPLTTTDSGGMWWR